MADLSDIITPTNVLTATSTNTVTNKTIAFSGNTFTGTLPAANGGTGLATPGANGNVLTSDGTAWTSVAPSAGVVGVYATSTPSVNLAKYALPSISALNNIGNVYFVKNTSDKNILEITTASGVTLGFLAPKKIAQATLANNATSDGVWQIEGADLDAYAGITPTSNYQSNLAISQAVRLDATRIIIAISARLVVYDESTATFGSVISVTQQIQKTILDDSGIVVCVLSNGANGYAQAFSVSGTTITAGSIVTVRTGTTYINGVLKMSAGVYMFVSSNVSGQRYVNIFSVSGTTVTNGGGATLTTGAGAAELNYFYNLILLSPTSALYHGPVTSNVITLSGTTPTQASSVTSTFFTTTGRTCIFSDNSSLATTGAAGSNWTYGLVTLSGTTLTQTTATIEAAGSLGNLAVVQVSGTKALACTWNDNTFKVVTITRSGGVTTVGTRSAFDVQELANTDDGLQFIGVDGDVVYLFASSQYAAASSSARTGIYLALDVSGAAPVLLWQTFASGYGATYFEPYYARQRPVGYALAAQTNCPVNVIETKDNEFILLDAAVLILEITASANVNRNSIKATVVGRNGVRYIDGAQFCNFATVSTNYFYSAKLIEKYIFSASSVMTAGNPLLLIKHAY